MTKDSVKSDLLDNIIYSVSSGNCKSLIKTPSSSLIYTIYDFTITHNKSSFEYACTLTKKKIKFLWWDISTYIFKVRVFSKTSSYVIETIEFDYDKKLSKLFKIIDCKFVTDLLDKELKTIIKYTTDIGKTIDQSLLRDDKLDKLIN